MHLLPRPLRNAARMIKRLRWVASVQPLSYMSGAEKRALLALVARETGIRNFVETGTYRGVTTLYMAERVERCFTVELDPDLCKQARASFAARNNIKLYEGDSATQLGQILIEIAEPTLFWLDGHYSGAGTAAGEARSPILYELGLIFAHHCREHYIMIDDAREFLGIDGYPTIRQLQKFVKRLSPGSGVRVMNDIIHIHRDLF
jgi:hypothetical protein